jgi:hypothetical protein
VTLDPRLRRNTALSGPEVRNRLAKQMAAAEVFDDVAYDFAEPMEVRVAASSDVRNRRRLSVSFTVSLSAYPCSLAGIVGLPVHHTEPAERRRADGGLHQGDVRWTGSGSGR